MNELPGKHAGDRCDCAILPSGPQVDPACAALPESLAARIAQLVKATRFAYASERDLQQGVGELLNESGIEAQPEVRITGGRIDYLAGAGTVGIEIKVQEPAKKVERQLRGYAAGDVEALVLVTTRSKHLSVPRELEGKPVRVVLVR